MANQTLALQVEGPTFDYPKALAQGQRIQLNRQLLESGQMDSQLKAMELEGATAERGALRDYRAAAGAGDPKALDRLKAYPEQQAKFHAAIEGMKPDEKAAALTRTKAIVDAAKATSRYAAGSPGQKAEWDKQLDALGAAGHLPPDAVDEYKRRGPSVLILEEAVAMGDYLEKYTGGADKVDARTKAVEDHMLEWGKTNIPKAGSYGTAPSEEQIASYRQAEAAERERITKALGTQRSPVLGAPGGGGQQRGPAASNDLGVLDLGKRAAAERPGDMNGLETVEGDQEPPQPAGARSPATKGNVGIGTIRRNTRTGERQQFDGKQWVPIK